MKRVNRLAIILLTGCLSLDNAIAANAHSKPNTILLVSDDTG
jgi:hypothetical protein